MCLLTRTKTTKTDRVRIWYSMLYHRITLKAKIRNFYEMTWCLHNIFYTVDISKRVKNFRVGHKPHTSKHLHNLYCKE